MKTERSMEEWISLNENLGQGIDSQWSPEEKQFFLNFINPQPGERILDLGCGNGVFSQWLSKLGFDVVGLDFSLFALKNAQRSQALSIQADLFSLPFKSKSFDRILFIEVFEHIPLEKTKVVLNEISRILKPNGTLIFHTSPNRIAEYTCLLMNPLLFFLKLFRWTQRPYFHRNFSADLFHVNKHTPKTLRQLIQKLGWEGSVLPYTSFCTFPYRLTQKFAWLESPWICHWFGLRFRGRLKKYLCSPTHNSQNENSRS